MKNIHHIKKNLLISCTACCFIFIAACVSPSPSTSAYSAGKHKTQKNIFTFQPIAFFPTGRFIAKWERGSILLIEPFTGKTLKELNTGVTNTILSLAFSPDGRYLAAGSYRRIMIWDMKQYKRIKTIKAHKDFITSLAFNPDGTILASGSKGVDRTIIFRDTTLWNQIRSLSTSDDYKYANNIRSMAFSPDNRYFAATGLDRRTRIWDVVTGKRKQVIKNSTTINSLCFSPDSRLLVSGDMGGNINVRSVADGTNIRSIKGDKSPITSIAFNRKGDYLAAAGFDRTLKLWNIETWVYEREIVIKETGAGPAFSKDLLTVAVLGQGGDISWYPLLGHKNIPASKAIAPIVSIIKPQNMSSVETEKVRLTVKAVDDEGINKITVTVNNVPISSDRRDLTISPSQEKTRRIEMDVLLKEGENRITVSAIDTDNLTSMETITVNRSAPRREVWGAVIGISRYEKVNNLKYADRDAEEFYKYLNEYYGIPEDRIFRLINEDATNKNVRDLLGVRLKRAASRNDSVIIYYAGHGASEPDVTSPDGDGLEKYLLPHDADPESLYSTALPMEDISKILGWIKAERVAFISDTCYSGASGRTIFTSRRSRAISNAFLDRISRGKGRVILTASEANEVSQEDDNLEHGVFTYYLLEALKGAADKDNNGLITVDEAYSYITEKVPDATGQNQHPVKKGDVAGEIILGRRKGGERW